MNEIPIGELAKVMGDRVEDVVKRVKLSMFRGVIMDTRVQFGRLRGNWQTTTGSPAQSAIDRVDPSGIQAIAEASATVQPDTVDYLTNNLPYAAIWNERDGYVERAIQRINRTVREQIRR